MSDIRNYYTVRTNAIAVWLQGGEIAYTNDASGVLQIWKTDCSGAKPQQLTFLKERVWRLQAAPNHRDLLFESDMGGNENTQIFLLKEGAEPENLTSDPAVRFYLGGMTPDGETIYFACNKRNPAHFDLCKMNVEDRKIQTVLKNSDNYNLPAAVSPDGVYMLYNKLKGQSDDKMWIINMETGDAQDIDPNRSYAKYGSPAWRSDSKGFYFTCDADSEFVYAAYCDAASMEITKVYETDWDVDALALSSDDRYLAMLVNEDGFSLLKIWDTVRKEFVNTAQPPKGAIASYYGLRWSPEGHRLVFTFTSGKRPAGIWVLDLEEDRVSRITESPFGEVDPDALVDATLGEFHSFDGLRVPYWYFRAPGRTAGVPGPVVLEIHGGPEGQETPGYSPLIQYLVSQGFDVVAPNVRGSVGYGKTYHHLDDVEKRLDSVHDVACLVQHLIDEKIADPKKIAVMGASYGGYMTLASITNYPDLWAAAVDTVGMSDLETFLENTSEYRRAHRESEYGTLAHDRETLRRVSPIHKVDQITAPLMVIHGANDPRVPVSEAEQIVASLRSRGVDVKYLRYEDEGHGLSKLKNKLDCYPQVAEFLKKYLQEDTEDAD